jgi:type I restriction enzyme, S subunit
VNAERLLQLYDRVSDAPDAIPRLRRFILNLAVCGRLVEHSPHDEPASLLRERIINERDRLTKAGEFREPRNAVEIDRERLPFSVPARWSWVRLIDIASVNYGFAFASSRFNNEKRGMPLIRIRDISKSDTEAYYDGDFDSAYVVSNGDYLVGMDGDFNLRCWQGKQALLNQRVMRISDWKCEVCPEFIKLPLQFVLDFLHSYTSQTTVKHLSAKQVNGIEIPLPPLAEQHRIAAKVDELMALCDSLETEREKREATRDRLTTASLSRLTEPDVDEKQFKAYSDFAIRVLPELTTRPDQIKFLRQTILDLAVRGKLVEQEPNDEPVDVIDDAAAEIQELIPTNWRCARLNLLLSEVTRNGYSRRPDDAEGGTPILRISAGTVRQDGVVAEEEHKRISGIDDATRLQFGLKPGDLLACRFNGNKAFVGRFKIFSNYLGLRPIYPDKLIRVRLNTDVVLPLFIRMAGDSDIVRRAIEQYCATTVGNWGISASNLIQVSFPVPPLLEQQRIVAKARVLMSLCDQLEQGLTSGRQMREFLGNSLLTAGPGTMPRRAA